MTTATPTPTATTIERAEELWGAARQCLLDLQGVIVTIISEKAWEPLGYNTFAAAWKGLMADVTIAPEIRARVVYQMFNEGLDADAVADAVKGVSAQTAALLQRQQDAGVPPELATRVKRRVPSGDQNPYTTLFIHLPRKTLERWRTVAKAAGINLEDLAFQVISDAMEQRQAVGA